MLICCFPWACILLKSFSVKLWWLHSTSGGLRVLGLGERDYQLYGGEVTYPPAIRNQWWMQKKNPCPLCHCLFWEPLALWALGAEIALGSEEEEGAQCPWLRSIPLLPGSLLSPSSSWAGSHSKPKVWHNMHGSCGIAQSCCNRTHGSGFWSKQWVCVTVMVLWANSVTNSQWALMRFSCASLDPASPKRHPRAGPGLDSGQQESANLEKYSSECVGRVYCLQSWCRGNA